MKRKILLAGLILITGIFALGAENVIVSGAFGWEPYLKMENGSPEGLSVDVLNEVSRRTDLTFEYKELPWNRALNEAEKTNGQVDIINAIYWTQERTDKYTFSTSYSQDKICVFARSNADWTFNSINDLRGKSGLLPLGGKYGDDFEAARASLRISEIADGTPTIVRMLAANRGDYTISSLFSVNQILKEKGLLDTIQPFSTPLVVTDVYFVANKASGGQAIMGKINRALEAMKADGTLKRIVDNYMNPDS